jgi:hypothetical protein
VGRRHTLIDPDWPLAEFASGLRALKTASKLTYKQMGDRVTFCVSVLSAAADGKHLPTLAVTLAYVRACGGSEREWRIRWAQARERIRTIRSGGGHG